MGHWVLVFFLTFFQLGFFYRVAEDDEGFNKHAVEDPEEIASMVDMWVFLPLYPSRSLSNLFGMIMCYCGNAHNFYILLGLNSKNLTAFRDGGWGS